MEDYPRNQVEFERRFAADEACREYLLRFNRRTSASRGKLFCRLIQNAVRVLPKPYRSMIKSVRGRKKHNHNI